MSGFREHSGFATAKAGYWKWGWNTVVDSHTCPEYGAELTKSFWKFVALSFYKLAEVNWTTVPQSLSHTYFLSLYQGHSGQGLGGLRWWLVHGI